MQCNQLQYLLKTFHLCLILSIQTQINYFIPSQQVFAGSALKIALGKLVCKCHIRMIYENNFNFNTLMRKGVHLELIISLFVSPVKTCKYFRPLLCNCLRVRAFFHKTVRVCHLYCNFKIGFTCRITVIFGTLKDGSLLINTLASNICFSYRNIFQNGVDALPKIVDAFLSKSSNFHLVRIIR